MGDRVEGSTRRRDVAATLAGESPAGDSPGVVVVRRRVVSDGVAGK